MTAITGPQNHSEKAQKCPTVTRWPAVGALHASRARERTPGAWHHGVHPGGRLHGCLAAALCSVLGG